MGRVIRPEVLKQQFRSNLHKRMLGRVWRWAGKYRQTERNIGIPSYKIPHDLQLLLDDCRYWVEHDTYEPDEIATRFHHRLIEIHPFPNGNGRHARLVTDILLKSFGYERFTWGQVSLTDARETRKAYVTALRAADKHDLSRLLAFVRS